MLWLILFIMVFWLILFIIVLSNYSVLFGRTGANDPSEKYEINRTFGSANCDRPLFLTPYIERGKIRKAKRLSKVYLPDNEAGNFESYSGYLTVNKACNSNIFFWFIKCEYNFEKAPVTLWLQGGPGTTSLYGLFQEIGPFSFDERLNKLVPKNYSWNAISSLLFIDNPVGTGFSFTEKDECYVTDEDGVRTDLYNALIQFFTLFAELKENNFFIFGESYAGKYVPAIAYSIYENNLRSELKINLKGLGIGNGWSDPENMLGYSDYLYQLGFVDEIGKNTIQQLEENANELIKNKQWEDAGNTYYAISQKILDLNSYIGLYNYEEMQSLEIQPYPFEKYVTNNLSRCALHVGNIPFKADNDHVFRKFLSDVAKSVKPWIEILLEKYPILFYNGQFDIMVPHPLTRNFVNKLNWSGAYIFKHQTQKPFYDEQNQIVCGYHKGYKNLNLVMVRKAGHMVPKDQPSCAFKMYKHFLLNDENRTFLR